jgi:glycine cleavage system transcriptional repressor
MQKNLVITLTGPDQVGLVERFTKLVLEYHGNVDASRMARLGGVFAILMLVSVPEEDFDALRTHIRGLRKEGYKLTTNETEQSDSQQYAGWMPYELALRGADHEGILHGVTQYLAEWGINIETMDTNMVKAPMSGIPLFMMEGIVVVPPGLKTQEWREGLEEIADRLIVEIDVSPYAG